MLAEAPEKLKSIPGFGMVQDPAQTKNGSQVLPKGSGNMSERCPEMPDGANQMYENSSIEKQGMPEQAPAEQEKCRFCRGYR